MAHSPFAVLIDLEDQCVELGFGFLHFEDIESAEENSDEGNGKHDGQHEEGIGEEQRDLSDSGSVVSVEDLHEGEEGHIEVCEHVQSDIGVELELAQSGLHESSHSALAAALGNSKDYQVHHENEPSEYADVDQRLDQLADGELIEEIVLVEEVVVQSFVKQRVFSQDQVSNQEWLESIIQVRNKLEVVERHEGDQLHVLDEHPQRQEPDVSEEKHDELDDHESNHHEVDSARGASHECHLLVSIVELHFNSELSGV